MLCCSFQLNIKICDKNIVSICFSTFWVFAWVYCARRSTEELLSSKKLFLVNMFLMIFCLLQLLETNCRQITHGVWSVCNRSWNFQPVQKQSQSFPQNQRVSAEVRDPQGMEAKKHRLRWYKIINSPLPAFQCLQAEFIHCDIGRFRLNISASARKLLKH